MLAHTLVRPYATQFRFEVRLNTATAQGTLQHAQQNTGLAPQAFQVIIDAQRRREDMNNHIAIIDQHPAIFATPLDMRRAGRGLFAHLLTNMVNNRVDLAVTIGGADDEKIGNHRDITQIHQNNVFAFAILNQTRY